MLQRVLLSAVLILALTLTLGLAGSRAAPSAGQEKPAPAKAGPRQIYFGVAACTRNCHDLPKPLDDPKFPPLCRCTEVNLWKEDKHGYAFDALKTPRSEEMARLLWDKSKLAHEATECLSCHAIVVTQATPVDRTFSLAEGVSCVVCHGPYAEWVREHAPALDDDRRKWRDLPRATKESQYGMRDLWDPVRRTQLCASCHIGNRAEGKVLTHAMYAAGHPPLPSFEPATFSDAMPRHWQYLHEKPPSVQALLKHDQKTRERSQLVTLGAVVTLEASLRLLAEEAQAAAKAGSIIDLANFDCAACHHDLRSPSWRQRRGFVGTPGRPTLPEWPAHLLEATFRLGEGAETTSHQVEWSKRLAALHRAVDARPFGDPASVSRAASSLADWASGWGRVLAKLPVEQGQAEKLLRTLSFLPRESSPDYDSARQRLWALRMVLDDLRPAPANGPSLGRVFEDLRKPLRLDLPAGRNTRLVDELMESLKHRADYDPELVRAALGKLAVRPRD